MRWMEVFRAWAMLMGALCVTLCVPPAFANSAGPVADASAGLTATASVSAVQVSMRPAARTHDVLPATRWRSRPEAALWTRVMQAALTSHAADLVAVVPRDIAQWCPAYPTQSPQGRAAFWVGLLSALAKHESTYRPEAVGGGGKWYGLLQISPATARGYGCRAGSGAALKHGAANLSCALRIMAVTVPRDTAVALRDTRWRGVAADWGPMRVPSKRADISAWTRAQSYCVTLSSLRPKSRPDDFAPPVRP